MTKGRFSTCGRGSGKMQEGKEGECRRSVNLRISQSLISVRVYVDRLPISLYRFNIFAIFLIRKLCTKTSLTRWLQAQCEVPALNIPMLRLRRVRRIRLASTTEVSRPAPKQCPPTKKDYATLTSGYLWSFRQVLYYRRRCNISSAPSAVDLPH